MGLQPVRDQGCGKRAEGLAYHDQVSAIADCLDHRIGVVVQPQRVVVCGKVGRHRAVSSYPQLGLDQVPVPADVASAVNQSEGTHGLILCRLG